MSEHDEDPADDHARAMDEARTLLSAGLVSELIGNTHRIAEAVGAFAGELREDRLARATEVASLRRRNAIQAVALTLALLLLAVVVFVGGARLTAIAQENRDSLIEQTDDFLDAAFCIAEHGFNDEAIVRACYDARRTARLAAQAAAEGSTS